MTSESARKLDDILSIKDIDLIEAHLTVGSREARSRFGKIVSNAKTAKNQFVITEHGEPAAAVVPISDLRILDWIKQRNLKNKISDAVFSEIDSLDEFIKTLLDSGGKDGNASKRLQEKNRGAA